MYHPVSIAGFVEVFPVHFGFFFFTLFVEKQTIYQRKENHMYYFVKRQEKFYVSHFGELIKSLNQSYQKLIIQIFTQIEITLVSLVALL